MSASVIEMLKGRCLCGGVQYQAQGPLGPVIACHCSMCARTSGNYAATTACDVSGFAMQSDRTLSWFRSSSGVERGFCRECGSNLFWREIGSDRIYVTAGTLDAPTGLSIAGHIFVGSKSDFYELLDGLPQSEETSCPSE